MPHKIGLNWAKPFRNVGTAFINVDHDVTTGFLKRIVRRFRKLAAVAILDSTPFVVNAAGIDFGALDSGSTQTFLNLQSSVSLGGFQFSVTYTKNPNSNATGVALCNTRCIIDSIACNGGEDLVPAAEGENDVERNVLILQESGTNVPDDAGRSGGRITFTLLSNDAFRFVGASAVDDAEFTFGTSLDGQLSSLSLTEDKETGKTIFSSSVLRQSDSFYMTTNGSGAFDSLVLAPVPVPASLPLLLAGVFGLGAYARRRKSH